MMTLSDARTQLCDFINYRKPVNMFDVHETFVVERMKMDKFFSDFLEETELEMSSDDTFSGPAWQTYKAKLKEYATLEQFIKQSQYYLNKNV